VIAPCGGEAADLPGFIPGQIANACRS